MPLFFNSALLFNLTGGSILIISPFPINLSDIDSYLSLWEFRSFVASQGWAVGKERA